MKNVNILVVDDEVAIADLIEFYLSAEGYIVWKYNNGTEALECLEKEQIDLAILDLMLPDVDGLQICKKIREVSNMPVLMVTAKGEEVDKITGLTIGADDYITKPFRPLELVARVKAQLRRYTRYNSGKEEKEEQEKEEITISGLVIDHRNHSCTLNGQTLSLTPTEFKILWTLCKNRGNVVTAEEMYSQIWGEKYYANSSSTIMVHIRHLREKMGDSAENPQYIKTVWGVGYKIG
ncbi:MAG: VanR-ABDEGLN family response regulator transcription factor [Lachnospiraceae bacterium]